MAEDTNDDATGTEAAQVAPERDYDALQRRCDALLETSRKWEGRAKSNADKARAYDELERRAEDARASLDEANARADRAEADLAAARRGLAVSRIAAERGVDADILAAMAGDDVDDIAANAERLAKSYASRGLYPSVTDGGAVGAPAATTDSIESIRDPLERVMARAEHINLYR